LYENADFEDLKSLRYFH